MFIGCSTEHNACHCFDPQSKKFFISHHVFFLESKFPFQTIFLNDNRIKDPSLSNWPLIDQSTHFLVLYTHILSNNSPINIVHSSSILQSPSKVDLSLDSSHVSSSPPSLMFYSLGHSKPLSPPPGYTITIAKNNIFNPKKNS